MEDPTLGYEPSPGPGRDVPNRPPTRASRWAPLQSLQHHFPHPPIPYGNSPAPCAHLADGDAAAHRGAQHPPEHPKTAPLAGARTFSWCNAGCSTNSLGEPWRRVMQRWGMRVPGPSPGTMPHSSEGTKAGCPAFLSTCMSKGKRRGAGQPARLRPRSPGRREGGRQPPPATAVGSGRMCCPSPALPSERFT